MARPKGIKLSATTTEQSEVIGVGLRALQIKNIGDDDVLIEFDAAINANSYLLQAGEIFTIEHPFITLYYKANASTATLYLIKVIQ